MLQLLAHEIGILPISTMRTLYNQTESLSHAENRALRLFGRYAISVTFIGPVSYREIVQMAYEIKTIANLIQFSFLPSFSPPSST